MTIEVYYKGIRFEWDDKKAASNVRKHGVSFEEAKTVFSDRLAYIFDDEANSIYEEREIIIGHSFNNRLLIVCFTERADTIRIFNARKATKEERKDYEKKSKH